MFRQGAGAQHAVPQQKHTPVGWGPIPYPVPQFGQAGHVAREIEMAVPETRGDGEAKKYLGQKKEPEKGKTGAP